MSYKNTPRPLRLAKLDEIAVLAYLEQHGETLTTEMFEYMCYHGLATEKVPFNTLLYRMKQSGLIGSHQVGAVTYHFLKPSGKNRIVQTAKMFRRMQFPDMIAPDIPESDYKNPDCIADHGTQEP